MALSEMNTSKNNFDLFTFKLICTPKNVSNFVISNFIELHNDIAYEKIIEMLQMWREIVTDIQKQQYTGFPRYSRALR